MNRIRLEKLDVRESFRVVVLVGEDGDTVDGAARLEVVGELLGGGGVVDAAAVDGAGVSLSLVGVGGAGAGSVAGVHVVADGVSLVLELLGLLLHGGEPGLHLFELLREIGRRVWGLRFGSFSFITFARLAFQ